MIREADGLKPLVEIIKTPIMIENKALIAAASGAIWKCAISDANVKVLDHVRAIIINSNVPRCERSLC